MSEVYYRIYYWQKNDCMTVVEMQDFDEYDYDQDHFYTNENGEAYKFEEEEEAVQFLNDNFKKKFIDPEYLMGDNLFGHMLKGAEGP